MLIPFTRTLLLALGCLTLLACAGGSKVTKSSVDPKLEGMDLSGVLVVAVTRSQSAREDFEAAFAKAINKRKERAVASYTLVPTKRPNAKMIVAAAKEAGLDTILITRYVGEDREEVYHPGRIYYGIQPYYGGGYYGGFDGYYGYAYEIARVQPVWSANVSHTLVSDLYVAETGKHVWQAVSETVESSNDNQTRNAAIGALIGDLQAQGLLP